MKAGSIILENDHLKVETPGEWTHSPKKQASVGSRIQHAEPGLVLEKDGYQLSLAYVTEHACGIVDGRFADRSTIPWLAEDQTTNCGN